MLYVAPLPVNNSGIIGELVWRDVEADPEEGSKFNPNDCENWKYVFPPESYENAKWLTIEDIQNVGVAKLEMRMGGTMYAVSDSETLELFYPMYIILKDGTVGFVNPATDSCNRSNLSFSCCETTVIRLQ